MNDIDPILSWKQPGTRTTDPVDHPAGEVRLGAVGRLTRRGDLLSGRSSGWLRNTSTFTQTCPISIAVMAGVEG